jgi:AraC family transcriptional regulator
MAVMVQACIDVWPPTGVSVWRRHERAGPIRLTPSFQHRLLVHASPATWTRCPSSGRRFQRHQGHIDIVPAGQEGGFDAEMPCDTLELRIPPGLIDRVADEAGRRAMRSSLQPRHMLTDPRICHLAWALDNERSSARPAGRLFVDSVGVALATQLLGLTKPIANSRHGLSSGQLQRVLDHVEAHMDSALTIEVLARIAGASSAHLRHWFKAQTGISIHRFVMQRRVERARTLLLQGEMKASEVALAAGFAHQSHMARWTRRALGRLPQDLRRKV